MPIWYSLNFGWVNGNTATADNISQEFHLFCPEITFKFFCIKLMVFKQLQGYSEVSSMFGFGMGVDKDIINKHHRTLIQK